MVLKIKYHDSQKLKISTIFRHDIKHKIIFSPKSIKIPTIFSHGITDKILITIFNHSIKDKISWLRKNLKFCQIFKDQIKTKYHKVKYISTMALWKNYMTKYNFKSEWLDENLYTKSNLFFKY